MRKMFKEIAVSGFVFFILLWMVTNQAVHSPLAIIDDHQIIAMQSDITLPPQYLDHQTFSSISGLLECDHKLGRSRPFYHIQQYIKAVLFGTNAYLWHICLVLVAILSTLLFYVCLRELGSTRWTAFFFSLFFLFNYHSETWWMLGPSESIGTLFLMAGVNCLLFARKRFGYELLGVIFLFISGLSKESFILLIPVVALCYYYYVFSREKTQISFYSFVWNKAGLNVLFSLACLLPLCLMLYVVLSNNRIFDYGEQSSTGLILINNVILALKPSVFLLPCLLFFAYHPSSIRKYLPYALLVVVWVICGVLVYKSITIKGRYYIPVMILPLIASAMAYDALKSKRILYVLLSAICFLFLLNNVKNVYTSSARSAREAVAFNKMLDFTAKNMREQVGIYIDVSQKQIPYEFIYSVMAQISTRTKQKVSYFICLDGKKTSAEMSGFQRQLLDRLTRDFPVRYLNDVPRETLVVSDVAVSLSREEFNIVPFETTYFDMSIRDMKWTGSTIGFYVNERKLEKSQH